MSPTLMLFFSLTLILGVYKSFLPNKVTFTKYMYYLTQCISFEITE